MAGTIDITEDPILEFRVQRFIELGFSDIDARLLAISRHDDGFPIDTQIVKRLLAAGCSHALAVRILV